jgi:hypothetical protein
MVESSIPNEEKPPMTPYEIASLIYRHMADCTEAARNNEPPSEYDLHSIPLADYLAACNEFSKGAGLLPKELLGTRIDAMLSQDTEEFLLNFPPGKRCCVTVIPVTPRGSKLTPEDMALGRYQTRLIVEKDTGTNKGCTIAGFSSAPSYIFNILPEEIQRECTFEVPDYDPARPDGMKKVVDLFSEAFEKARIIFNKNP